MLVSIVIPALNEAAALPATLASARAQAGAAEVIVADGDSRDATRRVAREHGARVVAAPRGRALQMNAGAAQARGEALLFLHADTHLPPGALDAVRRALSDARTLGGCFRARFDAPGALYRAYALAARLPLAAITFGDRALFARRADFDAIGGFPEQPIFEDIAFYRALSRRARERGGKLARLSLEVTTSARRFEARGAARQQLRNAALWLGYLAGVAPERLARHYRYEQ